MDPTANQNRKAAPSEDEIAVLELHFDKPHTLPFEEPKVFPVIRAKDRVSITYLPRKRFYRLVEKARHAKAEDIVFYIPESWALFLPAEVKS
jgi:hypothetical protein